MQHRWQTNKQENVEFYVHMTCIVINFTTVKINRRTNFQIYSGTKLYMFRTVSLPILRVIHCTFGIGICYTVLKTACVQDQDGTVDNAEDGQRNCPKHLEFRTRINLEISAPVGFHS
jgi:hypothetical protein